MSLHTTVPNFKIPEDYERLFMLRIDEFECVVIADLNGIHTGTRGPTTLRHGKVLDFIEESFGQIRCECEQLNTKRRKSR